MLVFLKNSLFYSRGSHDTLSAPLTQNPNWRGEGGSAKSAKI